MYYKKQFLNAAKTLDYYMLQTNKYLQIKYFLIWNLQKFNNLQDNWDSKQLDLRRTINKELRRRIRSSTHCRKSQWQIYPKGCKYIDLVKQQQNNSDLKCTQQGSIRRIQRIYFQCLSNSLWLKIILMAYILYNKIKNLILRQPIKTKQMSTAIVLIKFLVSRSREEFQLLIQSASTSVIGKMKQQLDKKTDDTTNESKIEKTEPEEVKPKLLLRKKVIIRENTQQQMKQPEIINRSVSVTDKLVMYSQTQESNPNPEKELKYQLRLQQRKLRKDLKNIYQPMLDLDTDHMWCSHAVLKKKFMKYPEKYFLKRGAFYIWKYLNNNNSDIRITIMNFAYRRAKLVIVDKILQEQIQDLHKQYNTTGQIPRQSLPLLVSCQQTPKILKHQIRLQQQYQVPNISQLPMLRSQHQQLKSMEFYEATVKDQKAHKSNKSLNLTQEQAKIQQKIKLQSSKDLI
ncbi:unnamed protein product [Paramecium octaurelia]|uniref:Transmembrane protein n=1 Tax=Paramecium octaurelia TaxID=43137 RepID=A0A8S1T134_PAROT|nr:unnamed protein product [Paramecium octaurelia]